MPPQSSSALIVRGDNLVGRKLADKLLSGGFKVSLFATPSPLEEIRLKPLLDYPNFKLFKVFDIEKIKKECLDTKIIYYFINEAQLDPKEIQDLEQVLEFAVAIKSRVILVSDLSVYQGVVSSASLDGYFGTSENDEKRFSQVEHKRYLEAVAWKVFKNKQLDLALVRLSTIYGPQMEFSQYPMGSMVKNVLENRPITVKGNGLAKHYFMQVEDAVEALTKVASLTDFSGRILVAVDKNLIAEIEIAYLLKALSKKKIEIKFSSISNEIVFTEPPNLDFVDLKTIGFTPKIYLKDGIKGVLDYHGFFNAVPIVEQVLPRKEEDKKEKTQNKTRFKFNFALIPIVLFALFAHPLIYTAKVGLGLTNFYKSFNYASSFNLSSAQQKATTSQYFLEQTAQLPFYLNCPEFSSFLKTHLYAVMAEIYYLKFYQSLSTNSKEAVTYITLASTNLNLARGEQKKVTQGFLKSKLVWANTLDNFLKLTANLPDIAESYSKLVGYDKPKSYIILFTDPAKIRPNGGLVTSYAKVSLDKGKVTNILVDDGANIDQVLQENNLQIKSPEPLEVILKEPNFVFSNMLWEPFFPKNASFIIDTFSKIDKKEYAGVVVLNLQVLSDILQVTGEVYVSANDKLVNANNIQTILKSYMELESNGASVGGKTFVSNLVYTISQKLLAGGYSQKTLLSLLYNNLNQKDILVYIPQASFFNKMNWDGNTQEVSSKDYLFVTDSNLSGARTNEFIKRNTSYTIDKSTVNTGLTATLSIDYEHNAKSNAWPSGMYVNYLRVYVPYGSNIVSANLTDIKNKRTTNIINGVTTSLVGFATSFETSFELKAQEKIQVQLVYNLPLSVFDSSRIEKNYSLVVQKQPGTVADPFNFVFNGGAKPFKSQTLLSEDRTFTILDK